MKKNLQCIFLSCALISTSLVGLGQITPPNTLMKGNPQLNAIPPQQPFIEKSHSIISPDLKNLSDTHDRNTEKDSKTKPVQLTNGMENRIQILGDKVVVDISIKGDDNKKALAELEKLGFETTGAFGRVISGLIPISALTKLEATTTLRYAKPAYKPMHQPPPVNTLINSSTLSNRRISPNTNTQNRLVKPVISQGDTAQRSYIAREKYHVNGKGVKVGIISNSYNALGTAGVGVAHGELPGPGNPFGFTDPVEVLLDDPYGGDDEGRGMAEIVHDVAPGADLAFYSGDYGQASFAQGIQELADAGCKVVNDDESYFDEPFFQDGIIAQSVDLAKQKGVTYFSAAGNESIRSYESNYRPSEFTPFGHDFGTAHNFSAPRDIPRYSLPVYIPTGGAFVPVFQWDQPSYASGGPGPATDLDIYLLDSHGYIVAASQFDNIANGEPFEFFQYINQSYDNTFFLVILKYTGPDPNRIKYIDFGNAEFYYPITPETPGILAPTLFGHAKADGAIATAAAAFYNTPAYGVNPPLVEYFSSMGGVANYLDTKGNRIAPVIRKKPEITAPDGGNTSFFPPASLFGNQDIPEDTDTFPNFFGTSAAAPHSSGVAALMISAHQGTLTPDQIKAALENSTIDMDNIYYTAFFDKGFDFNTGYGLIQADAAVGAVASSSSSGRIMSDETIDAKEINKLNTAEVYPNPSTTSFRVYLSLAKSQNADLELYSSDGKRLYQKTSQPSGIIDIDATHYKPGLYILKVRQGEFTKTIKLIKQ